MHLPAHYLYGRPGFQYEVNRPWISSLNIHYHVGVDGISLWLVVLSAFLAVIGVLASWNAIADRTKEFYFFFLLQQTAMIGVFVALDIFLYYAFWEFTLVPMAILIAMFGRERGTQAALKFFLYTFLPSALFLAAILWLYAKTGTFDFVQLQTILAHDNSLFSPQALFWISLAFLAAFAVKVPVFPLHGWLSDTFSEAPTAMAMVVAGKLGLYSILRFNLGLFPAQARQVAPWMIALAVAGVLYGALLALVAEGSEEAGRLWNSEQLELLHPGYLLLLDHKRRRRGLSDHQRRHRRSAASSCFWAFSTSATAHLEIDSLRWTRRAHAQPRHSVCHQLARFDRPASLERLRRRVPRPQRQLLCACRLGLGRTAGRHPERGLHAGRPSSASSTAANPPWWSSEARSTWPSVSIWRCGRWPF